MPAVTLSPRELKFLYMALNKGAAPNEVSVSALRLIGSLRERGVEAQDFERAFAVEPPRPDRLKPDYGLCTMPWGKNKGKIFADIPPSDLRSAVDWAKSISGGEVKFRQFIANAEEFFRQGAT
jgi:hypothetical protein